MLGDRRAIPERPGLAAAPDFVAIGHLTLDRIAGTLRPGGAALYAAVTADRLGLSAGILTSHGDDFPLDAIPPRIEVVSVPSGSTTTFTHVAEPGGRRLLASREVATPLQPQDVPEDWRSAPLVLLAPVLGEVDGTLARAFDDASVAAAAQGWLRSRQPDGTVAPAPWEDAPLVLPGLQALFVSDEDTRGLGDEVQEWFQHVPIGAFTAGRHGALLFVNGERYDVRPLRVSEMDETGAGDVFAAAFLAHYHRDGEPWEAAAAAACAAALSVERPGLEGIPDAARLASALAGYHKDL